MGLFSWLFPSEADRLALAKELIAKKRFVDAKEQLERVPAASQGTLLLEADHGLVQANLDHAVGLAAAGDAEGCEAHMALAESFHHGGLEDVFREARRKMRAAREETEQERQRAEAREQRQLARVDAEGGAHGPSWLNSTNEPFDAERDELEARLALLIEGYPEGLRASATELGPSFAQAALDLDEGRPDLALNALIALSDDAPLVQWERARTAMVLGDAKAAARSARRFAELAGRHHPIGNTHSAMLLAQALAGSGDAPGALRVLRDQRSREPRFGGPLVAQLLVITGDLPNAEAELLALLQAHPKERALYRMLSDLRVQAGHRGLAKRALEQGLEACDCAPGRCGYQPPDLAMYRALATLYLEDGEQFPRASELASQALEGVKQPVWEDAYLDALLAMREGREDAPDRAAHLLANTPAQDPRHARAHGFLASAASR